MIGGDNITMEDNKLYHHGVKGQKWGVRRYQNKDGSLTPLGEKRADRLNASKTAEELKAKRNKRKLEEQKAKHDMKEDAKDRANARKIANKKADAEIAAAKSKQLDDDRYELPEESEGRTEKRVSTGKAVAAGILAAVGTATAIYAIKKFRDNKAKADETVESVDGIIKKEGSVGNIFREHLAKVKAAKEKTNNTTDTVSVSKNKPSKDNDADSIIKELDKSMASAVKADKKAAKQHEKAVKRLKNLSKEISKDSKERETFITNYNNKHNLVERAQKQAIDNAKKNRNLSRSAKQEKINNIYKYQNTRLDELLKRKLDYSGFRE
jgi:hypothetical protein